MRYLIIYFQVFEDVVEVLDPEMNIDSDAEEDSFEVQNYKY